MLDSTCSCWSGAEVDAFLLWSLLSFILFLWLSLQFIFFSLFRSLARILFLLFTSINQCLCLFLGLSLELRDHFIPIICAGLVSAGEFATHIYEMRFFLLSLLVLAVGGVEHKLFICKFQMGTVEVHCATLWLTVGDRDVNSVSLEYPLYFSCHLGNI